MCYKIYAKQAPPSYIIHYTHKAHICRHSLQSGVQCAENETQEGIIAPNQRGTVHNDHQEVLVKNAICY